MNGCTPEARKSLFVKQSSFGGMNAATSDGEGGGGGLSDTRNGGMRLAQENIGEEGKLFTEGIFSLSCKGDVEKVRLAFLFFKNLGNIKLI